MAVGGMVVLAVAVVAVPRSWWAVLASGWLVLVPVAGGSALLVAGVLLWRRDGVKHEVSAAPMPPDRQVRPLRSWVIPAGVVLVAVVTWAAVAWLQGSVPSVGDGVQRAQLRVDSIRTGLTIGASVTAAFALLLAFRRQQLAERTQQATEYDAGEKRVTELYVKAADQLGSDKAPVRLAGLYALERLAQDNPAHRQSIVEVICAYLRMPYTPPGDKPAPGPDNQPAAAGMDSVSDSDSDRPAVDAREERQVRLAAQRILARHLRPASQGEPDLLWWGTKVALDLTEAVLINVNFDGCHLHNATFTKTHFTGTTSFNDVRFSGDARFYMATFNGDAWFGGATFSDGRFFKATFSNIAWFAGATFNGNAAFGGVTFSEDARFEESTFNGLAGFNAVTFSEDARFEESTFNGDARFDKARFGFARFGGARFAGDARFGGATFKGDAGFYKARFNGHTRFDKARFNGDARFGGATFSDEARFEESTFNGDAGLDNVEFSGFAGFDNAAFNGYTRFDESTFNGNAWFGGATFIGATWFGRATFNGDARFDKARFSGDARFDKATFNSTASFDGTTLAGTTYNGPEPVADMSSDS